MLNGVGSVYAVEETVITFADSVTVVAPEPCIFLKFNCEPSFAENKPIPEAPTLLPPVTAAFASAETLSCATKIPCVES